MEGDNSDESDWSAQAKRQRKYLCHTNMPRAAELPSSGPDDDEAEHHFQRNVPSRRGHIPCTESIVHSRNLLESRKLTRYRLGADISAHHRMKMLSVECPECCSLVELLGGLRRVGLMLGKQDDLIKKGQ